MTNSLALLTIGSILVAGIISHGFYVYDFVLFSSLSASSHDMPVDSYDNINRLFYEFNSFMGSLYRETHLDIFTKHIDMSYIHIDMSTKNNSNEFVKYWL